MTEDALDAFSLVIFDWAGTTVDFGCQAPVAALIEAFDRRGVHLPEDAARADMGKAKADHVRAILARPSIAEAWAKVQGARPGETAVAALMADLEPLMREAAAEAAQVIPGVVGAVEALRAAGVKIASSTGYSRFMMDPVLACAADQGYVPDHLVCAGETPQGRPAPLMIYKACAELGVWPLSRVVKVDDSEAGVAEGKAAGCLTVGVAASGNLVGLSAEALAALDPDDREGRIRSAREILFGAGADMVVDTVADLVPALVSRVGA